MKIIFLAVLAIGGYFLYQAMTPPFDDSRDEFLSAEPLSPATLRISGMHFPITFERGLTVGEAIRRSGFPVTAEDEVYPTIDQVLSVGMTVAWRPARIIRIAVDGEEKAVSTIVTTSEEVIAAAGITLDEDDIVKPPRTIAVAGGTGITITRVEIREETKETKIPYVTKVEEDDELSWRKRVVTQKGENGIQQTVYRVSYHDNEEVNRKVLSTTITKEPITEIVTQGTFVKTGKSHRGAASWYAWTGTMAAANPWLPKGSYVRVTNVDNGKSVIVVINDRGPFVPGRIIDLDKVAFEKIASIGAGVINVKMDEIIN